MRSSSTHRIESRWTWLALAAVSATGCAKPAPSNGAPAASAAASSLPVAKVGAAPTASSAPAAKATLPSVGRWSGSYVAKVGHVEPPKAANEKAWLDDPGATGTGRGTVEVVVGDPVGEARGQLKGALGDLLMAGTFDGRELYANLHSAQPNAEGALTGVVTLMADGPTMKGVARLSGPDGKTVRDAELELKRQ